MFEVDRKKSSCERLFFALIGHVVMQSAGSKDDARAVLGRTVSKYNSFVNKQVLLRLDSVGT